MSRTVYCKKYEKEMEGLDAAPYPGPKGQDIFENVSKQAWADWQAQQTMLINEKHLSLVDVDDGQGKKVRTLRITGVNVQIVNGLGATNGNPARYQ